MGKIVTSAYPITSANGIKINTSIKCNSSNYGNDSNRQIKYIVLHYTGNPKDTAKANCNYFKGANRQASAHYFVDETSIYQSVELRDVAWHCGGYTYYHKYCRNSNAVGIEMCCSGDYKVSATTIKNAAHLTAQLCEYLNITSKEVDTYVLRHYDVTHKKCPAQMVDNSPTEDKDWVAFKKQVKEILDGGKKSTTTTSTTSTANKSKEFKVKVTADVLNIRAGASTTYRVVGQIKDKGIYTIVKQSGSWGKLKSGAGWISLSYTKRV